MNNKLKYFDLRICLAFFVVVFAGTFLHELGHYVVAKQYYQEVDLYLDHVSYERLIEPGDRFFKHSITILAGPISSNLISLIGMGILLFSPLPKLEQSRFPYKSFIAVIASLFCLRSMLIGIFLLSGIHHLQQDEYIVLVQGFELNRILVGGALVAFGLILSSATMILGVERTYRKDFMLNASVGMFLGFLLLLQF